MFTTSDGIQLDVQTQGTGPPMLLIHGFPLSRAMWSDVLPALSRDHRCLLPDLRGHGDSGVSPETSIDRLATDLGELLAAAQVREPAVVVGLSMGGILALEFLQRYRHQTRALVLANCRAGGESAEGVARREDFAARVLTHGSELAADEMLGRVLGASAPQALRQRVRDMIEQTSAVGIAATSRALARRADLLSTLSQTDVPVLLISGSEDVITPPEVARDLQARISPAPELVEIPRAGHLTPMEQPAAFAAAVRAFVDRL